MKIPITWEATEQPSDDDNAGNVWFWAETYREFHQGLKLVLQHLKSFEDLARELELKASPFDEQVQRIEMMIAWGEARLGQSFDITLRQVSYGSLRYLKAGVLLRAGELLKRRQDVLSQRQMVPSSFLQAFDARIQQLLNFAEQGVLKALRPAELFFEASALAAGPPSVAPQGEPHGVIADTPYSADASVIDPVLRERCLPILNAFDDQGLRKQFDTVIREMSVVVEDRVRSLSGCEGTLSGLELFAAAMTGTAPRIKFSDRKDLQEAAHLLFRGYSGFVRNDVMHRLHGGFTRERVLQLLGMVDYLLDLLAHAEVQPQS